MNDEKYVFTQDVREKKITARSSRHTRTHCGKGGAVKFPSDYLTKKELKAMSGEVKSYRLNEPMPWKEFKAMPDDIKVTYIKLLRDKFNCFDSAIAEMMGVNKCTFSQEIKRLGLGHGKKHGGYRTWHEKDAFYAWANGVPGAAPVEETPETVEQSVDETPETIIPLNSETTERFMASLEKVCDPVPVQVLPVCEEKRKAIPRSGSMNFEGLAEDVLNTVSVLLGGAKVSLCISWEVCPEEGACEA